MSVKHFEMALQDAEADPVEDEFITFTFPDDNYDDGVSPEFRAYKPSPSQFAMAMSALGPRRDVATQAAGIIDFLVEILDEEGQVYVENRLRTHDRIDPFGLKELEQLLRWIVEEWSGRPTVPSSASTRSALSGGRRSKPRTTKKTSSASA